jgi:hypothetical protein
LREVGTGMTDQSRLDIMGRFVRGKSAPTISLAIDFASGQTYMGEDVTLAKEAGQYLAPLGIRSTIETAQNEGLGITATSGISNIMGLSTNVYPRTGWYPTQTYSFDGQATNALGETTKKYDRDAWKLIDQYKVDVSPPNKSRQKIYDEKTNKEKTYNREQYFNFVKIRGQYIKEEVKALDEQEKLTDKNGKTLRELMIDGLMESVYADGEKVYPDKIIATKVYDEIFIPQYIQSIVRSANEYAKSEVEGTEKPSKEDIDIRKMVDEYKSKMKGK